MRNTRADILRQLRAATFWSFIVLVMVPLLWGVVGLLLTRLSDRVGSVLLVPLFFYSWPATVVFGSEHFNMHACCLPSDWVGLAQVVGFYTLVAAILGIAVGAIQAVRNSRTNHANVG